MDKVLQAFVTARDSAESIRTFVQHAELREPRAEALLQAWTNAARDRNLADVEVLLSSRAALLAALREAAGEVSGGAPLEQALSAHPSVQALIAGEAGAATLHEEIKWLLKHAASARSRYERSRDATDLREALARMTEIVEHASFAGTPEAFRAEVLDAAGEMSCTVYAASASVQHLRLAMDRWESWLLPALPASEQRWVDMGRRVLRLLDACAEHQRKEDLDTVFSWQHRLLLASEASAAASTAKRLGDRARGIYGETRSRLFLEYALATHRDAIAMVAPDDPGRPEFLDTLALDLKMLFDLTPEQQQLDEAIHAWEEALDIGLRTPGISREHVADFANNLGAVYIDRFEITGKIEDLEHAAVRFEHSLELGGASQSNRAARLSNAGSVHVRLFEKTSDIQHLRQAVHFKEEALLSVPEHSEPWNELAAQVAGLSIALHTMTPERSSVDRAVELPARVLEAGSLPPREAHNVRLQLAQALRLRYELDGAPEDFDRAARILASASEQAGALSDRRHPVHAEASRLFQARYRRTGDPTALVQATALLQAMVDGERREPEPDRDAVRTKRRRPRSPDDTASGPSKPLRRPPAAPKPSAPPASPSPAQTPAVLSAEGPRELAVGATASIHVRIERAQAAAPLAHRVEAKIDAEQPITVVLTVHGHLLTLVDSWVKVIDALQASRASTCEFRVRGEAPGETEVAVQFLQGQAALGSLAFSILVKADHAAAEGQRATGALSPTAPAEAGTLMLLIQEARAGDRVFFRYLVSSETLGVHFETYESPRFEDRETASGSTPLAYVRSVYRHVAERALVNWEDVKLFQRELQGVGVDLCRQLFPPDLVRLLWDHRDDIRVVHVISWEPYIPWELVRLAHPDRKGAKAIDPRFLAEYQLVRTLSGKAPPNQLGSADWRYFVAEFPHGSYTRTDGELQFFRETLPAMGVHSVEVAPQPNDLLDLLAEGEFDVLHVAGHGETAPGEIEDAVLIVRDRRTPEGIRPVVLKPGTVEGVANLVERHPLIFLNACETGRQGPSLTALGGWPRAFLRAGAGAYVGTSWAVRERPAVAFAHGFYQALLEGRTLAEASRRARDEAKKLADASWLAFTVYGSPSARLTSIAGTGA